MIHVGVRKLTPTVYYVARGVLSEDWAAGESETARSFGEPA